MPSNVNKVYYTYFIPFIKEPLVHFIHFGRWILQWFYMVLPREEKPRIQKIINFSTNYAYFHSNHCLGNHLGLHILSGNGYDHLGRILFYLLRSCPFSDTLIPQLYQHYLLTLPSALIYEKWILTRMCYNNIS